MNRLYAPFRLVFGMGRALSENLAFLEKHLCAVHQRVDYGLSQPREGFTLPWLCDLKAFSFARAFFYLFGLFLTVFEAGHGMLAWNKVMAVGAMGFFGLFLIAVQYRLKCQERFALLMAYLTGFFDFTVLLALGAAVGFDHPFVFISMSFYWVVMPLNFSFLHWLFAFCYVGCTWFFLHLVDVPLFRFVPAVIFQNAHSGWLQLLGFWLLYFGILYTAGVFGQRARQKSILAADQMQALNRYNALAQTAVSLARDLSGAMNLESFRVFLEANVCRKTQIALSAGAFAHSENDLLLKGNDQQYFILFDLKDSGLLALLRSEFHEVVVSLLADKFKICQAMEQMLRFQTETLPDEQLRAISSLSAGIAHEINNPLHFMTLRCQIMKSDLSQAKRKDFQRCLNQTTQGLEVIQQGCERIATIVQHMTILGKPPGKTIRNSLSKQLQAATTLLDHRLQERQITLKNMAVKKCGLVMADNLAGQVFFNVLSNAVEALDAGGKIRVSAQDTQEFMVVSVSDNGQGMDSTTVAKAFRPFFTTKFGRGGLGMGLTVSQKIMREFGGKIVIDSKPKKGTHVNLYFPKSQQGNAAL